MPRPNQMQARVREEENVQQGQRSYHQITVQNVSSDLCAGEPVWMNEILHNYNPI